MGFSFGFRRQIYGAWEDAQGFLVQTLTDLMASLGPLAGLQENLPATYPANSVLVTDAQGRPSWVRVLPSGLTLNSPTKHTRLDGSAVLPTATNFQAAKETSAGETAPIAHTFTTMAPYNHPNLSVIALEGFGLTSQSGTTDQLIGVTGIAEHCATGTSTKILGVRGETLITGSGGGTEATCLSASPSGRAFGGTGTYTNGYGVKVNTFGTGYTNKYAFYADDGVSTNVAQPICSAFNSAVQSVATASFVTLTFDSESYDVGGMHSTSANTSRVTVPAGADGRYFINASTTIAAIIGAQCGLTLTKNGTAFKRMLRATANVQTEIEISAVELLVAGDYIEVQVYQDSGGNLNIGSGTASTASRLVVAKLW